MERYQLAIIGGGPGGYVAALRAAQNGLKTVLIEKDWIGGTCLNIGCIPTKALIKDAEILHEIRHAERRGIHVSPPQVDMAAVMENKGQIVSQLTAGVSGLLKANGVTVHIGEAVVGEKSTLMVSGSKKIGFDNLIIAAGSSNMMPPVSGIDTAGILTSTEALSLTKVPESMAIIGGGVIGCELATVFAQFGCKVTIIEMMPRLVSSMDVDISKELKKRLSAMGITVMTGSSVAAVERDEENWIVRTECSKEVTAKSVLVSVGRRANTAGLESLCLQWERGYIKTNAQMQTNLPGVYAIGDVTGTIQLAHVASAQGIVAADHIAGKPAEMKYDIVPSCIYTIPEIAAVGMSEAAAREICGADGVVVGKFPMMACGKALAMGSPNGFAKIIAEKKTGKLLGCHIIGPSATEIIGEATAVMHFGGTLQDIADTIHAHPTVAESVMEAAHMALGEPVHMPPHG